MPVYEQLLKGLYNTFLQIEQPHNGSHTAVTNSTITKINYGNQSLGLVMLIGLDFMKVWLQTSGELASVKNMYHFLYSYFGDSLLLLPRYISKGTANTKEKLPRAKARIRILRKLNISGKVFFNFGSTAVYGKILLVT